MLDDPVFESRPRQEASVFSIKSRTPLRPPSLQFNQYCGSFLEVRLPGREADCSSPSIAKLKNEWSYNSTPRVRLYFVYRDGCTFVMAYFYSSLTSALDGGGRSTPRIGRFTPANVPCALELTELFSNGYPDDGLLKCRNM
jgi:hypothetical protein